MTAEANDRGEGPRHWADEAAESVLVAGRDAVVSSGISPSGEIHIGNMREVLTADAVFRALRERGVSARFNYVADNFDPLRRVYPFLDPSVYEPLIGRPLSEIPCPCGAHGSYADHFLEPFLAALRTLHVEVGVEHADRMYKSGGMNEVVLLALEGRDRIAAILKELTGKQVEEGWSPFNPLCPACGKITQASVTGFSRPKETVDYACACGAAGAVPIAGGGKLTWRVDWPARWRTLGVTVEPFGKDHATRGGSYDTGVRISREIFSWEPPYPIAYEWISLKGKGDMSSSKGNVLSISQALEVVPPEALRYLVMRERPARTITFDPGEPLLALVDAVEAATASGNPDRALELSRAAGFAPAGVPFKHLVVVAQAAAFDLDAIMGVLDRAGYPGLDRDAVSERLGFARRWLERFAPEDLKFEVRRDLPEEAASLDPAQRAFLAAFAARLAPGHDAETIHQLIYELAPAAGVKPAEAFQAIYVALLGKPRGPRAGWFVTVVGAETCAARFRQAAASA